MVFNYGPNGTQSSSSNIDFDIGTGGGKFDPLEHFEIKFNENDSYQSIKFYENESSEEKQYYELKYQDEENSNIDKWYIKFLNNCFINLKKSLKNCEIFMVGKGSNGGTGSGDRYFEDGKSNEGGKGGDGGKINILQNISLKNEYTIFINENMSSIKENGDILYSSDGNYNNNNLGGSGGKIISHKNNPDIQEAGEGRSGVKKYNIYYGAGGGGGGVSRLYESSNGSPYGNTFYLSTTTGGANGGGNNTGGKGSNSTSESNNGKPNTGSGGGGAYQDLDSSGAVGIGSYGTIIISS